MVEIQHDVILEEDLIISCQKLQLACGASGGRGILCRMFKRPSGNMRPTYAALAVHSSTMPSKGLAPSCVHQNVPQFKNVPQFQNLVLMYPAPHTRRSGCA